MPLLESTRTSAPRSSHPYGHRLHHCCLHHLCGSRSSLFSEDTTFQILVLSHAPVHSWLSHHTEALTLYTSHTQMLSSQTCESTLDSVKSAWWQKTTQHKTKNKAKLSPSPRHSPPSIRSLPLWRDSLQPPYRNCQAVTLGGQVRVVIEAFYVPLNCESAVMDNTAKVASLSFTEHRHPHDLR